MFSATFSQIVPVESSSLAWVRYALELRQLQVCFHDGDLYEYDGVPADSYEQLLAAPSKGIYFNRKIRNSFVFKRLRRGGEIK